jgi:hypothetical protein
MIQCRGVADFLDGFVQKDDKNCINASGCMCVCGGCGSGYAVKDMWVYNFLPVS